MSRTKWLLTAAMTAAMAGASTAQATPLISEIFFNPPGGTDASTATDHEYIELMGTPNASLNNHFLIFLESEKSVTNKAGYIDNVFDLSGMTFGSNGYLVLAMKNTKYPALAGANNVMEAADFDITTPAIATAPTLAESKKTMATGANAYINRTSTSSVVGWGGVSNYSSIGHSKASSTASDAQIEGGGFTAWLIHVDYSVTGTTAPVSGNTPATNIDADEDGVIDPFTAANGRAGWTILDSIGVIAEPSELGTSGLFGAVNFGPGALTGTSTSTGIYVDTSAALFEIEYVARMGVLSGPENWLAVNVTDNAASGYTAAQRNYGVSGTHATQTNPEVYQGFTAQPSLFPYGTDVTTTLGAPNFGFSSEVPEPASLVLLAAGAGLVAFRRTRKA